MKRLEMASVLGVQRAAPAFKQRPKPCAYGCYQRLGRLRAIESGLERATGIELTSDAWEACSKNP